MPTLHVCPLSRLHDTVTATRASHVVSLMGLGAEVERPAAIAAERHLFIGVSDIVEPLEGHVLPAAEHIEQLLAFVRAWEPREPARPPLLGRDQPLDRRRLYRGLRAGAGAGRSGPRAGPARGLPQRHPERPLRRARRRHPRAGRAGWSMRSAPSAGAPRLWRARPSCYSLAAASRFRPERSALLEKSEAVSWK